MSNKPKLIFTNNGAFLEGKTQILQLMDCIYTVNDSGRYRHESLSFTANDDVALLAINDQMDEFNIKVTCLHKEHFGRSNFEAVVLSPGIDVIFLDSFPIKEKGCVK